jgi:hypothetical protein
MDARELAAKLLSSPEYQASLRQRLVDGDVPEEIECLLWEIAYGPPRAQRRRRIPVATKSAAPVMSFAVVPRVPTTTKSSR